MIRRFARLGLSFALSLGLASLPGRTVAADEKDVKSPGSTAKEAPAKAPDWSKYVTVGDVFGEIIKADEKKITLRVTWFVAVNAPATRPQIGNNRNFHRPNNMRPPMMKEMHHDYELEYVPESLVRTKILPPKYDDNGKRTIHTTKELEALKTPQGVVGYVSSPSDLTPGTLADVILIRDKSVPASKATEDDLRVKYAIIMGTKEMPTPPAAAGTPPKKN